VRKEKKKKMSSSTAEGRREKRIAAAVVTVSDSCARRERRDISGPSVAQFLEKSKFKVVSREIVPDDLTQIEDLLIRLAAGVRLIVTTGGTGIAPRDVTPEATVAVCDRVIPGVAEQMRREGMKKTARAVLSRGVCGVLGTTLILNLPGSPSGAVESLEAVGNLIPHMIDLVSGKTEHDKDV
jgi:molybdopterin adenylyltransferase